VKKITIGITYDLKTDYRKLGYSVAECAEFDAIETIDAIENALNHLGYKTVRIGNLFALIERLNKGEKWDLVFNIAEGMYGYGREAQIPTLLEAYQIPFTFSDSLVCAITLHKGMSKRIVKYAGMPTSAFAEIYKIEDIDRINFGFPMFVKPLAEGSSKGIHSDSLIESEMNLREIISTKLSQTSGGLLVEEFLSGREFTTAILAGKVLGTMEVVPKSGKQTVYGFDEKQEYTQRIEYLIPEKDIQNTCSRLALQIWELFKCRDASRVDFKMNSHNEINFIEINPLAGLHPVDSDLIIIAGFMGIAYVDIIREIVESAWSRYK